MDWSALGTGLLEIIAPFVVICITSLVSWALLALKNKFNLQISDAQEMQLRGMVRNGIMGAEEWAAKKFKLDTETKATSVEKVEWVQKFVARKFPNLLPDELEDLISQELAQIKGVGATGLKVLK